MKKLSIGLAAAIVLALAAAPASAKGSKKSSKKSKGKAEAAQVEAHPMSISCTLNAWLGAKQPKACGG